MSEAQNIRDKYQTVMDDELKELQRDCSHGEVSDWMEVFWAPAHGTGTFVKECKRCGKILHNKTHCNQAKNTGRLNSGWCGKEIVDDEIVDVLNLIESGKVTREQLKFPMTLGNEVHLTSYYGSHICKECFDEYLEMCKREKSK